MFDLLPKEAIAAVAAVVVAVFSFILGGRNRKHKDRAKRAEADKDAAIKRKEKNDEIERLSSADRRRRVGKWVRPPK